MSAEQHPAVLISEQYERILRLESELRAAREFSPNDEVRSIALSVHQAKWNDSEIPDSRPDAATFALWVGYAKQLARAVLFEVPPPTASAE